MTGKIYITGDKHGSFETFFKMHEKGMMNENDIMLIAGDAGYVWNEDYLYKTETLKQLFPGVIAFIDGNHENHVLLNSMEVSEWKGGKVHKVDDRVYHLMRGEMYSILGNNIFTFGGARSNDIDRRTEGETWWREEEPLLQEIGYGRIKLMENINEIDYVITHESPVFARDYISRFKEIEYDYYLPAILDDWYELIADGIRFRKWYFGHMHVDQAITPRLRCIYNDVLVLGEDKPVKWW